MENRARKEGNTLNFGNVTRREWLKCVYMCRSPELRLPEACMYVCMYACIDVIVTYRGFQKHARTYLYIHMHVQERAHTRDFYMHV